MTLDWQLLAVTVVIAAAGLYLARSVWLWLRPKKTACGGGCGCSSAASKQQLISLNTPRHDSHSSSQGPG